MVPLMKKIALLITLFILLIGCKEEVIETDALVYEEARKLKPFTLINKNNEKIDNNAFTGGWNLLFLGYTSCPDICPMTLSKLKSVKSSLQADYNIKVWLISVDPARDTAEKLLQYTNYFDPEFIGATAGHKDLFPFVRDLGLMYAMADENRDNYSVDHSASIALVSPQGELKAIFKPEFKVGSAPTINTASLIADFKKIVK